MNINKLNKDRKPLTIEEVDKRMRDTINDMLAAKKRAKESTIVFDARVI